MNESLTFRVHFGRIQQSIIQFNTFATPLMRNKCAIYNQLFIFYSHERQKDNSMTLCLIYDIQVCKMYHEFFYAINFVYCHIFLGTGSALQLHRQYKLCHSYASISVSTNINKIHLYLKESLLKIQRNKLETLNASD